MQTNCINQIPGKILASCYSQRLNELISHLAVKPTLAVVQVGSDPASSLYVNLKAEMAREVGMNAKVLKLPLSLSKAEIIAEIAALNTNPEITGIIIQAPIPELSLLESLEIFNKIAISKDVDGLTDYNLGRLWQLKTFSDLNASNILISATPLAVLKAIAWVGYAVKRESEGVSKEQLRSPAELNNFLNLEQTAFQQLIVDRCAGRQVLIINRSNIVGKPLTALLEMANATVTLAHSLTPNLRSELAKYAIVITATGRKEIWSLADFTADQLVLDVGINNSEPGEKVRGDINLSCEDSQPADFNGYLATVPGGVGPLTVISLLENTLKAN